MGLTKKIHHIILKPENIIQESLNNPINFKPILYTLSFDSFVISNFMFILISLLTSLKYLYSFFVNVTFFEFIFMLILSLIISVLISLILSLILVLVLVLLNLFYLFILWVPFGILDKSIHVKQFIVIILPINIYIDTLVIVFSSIIIFSNYYFKTLISETMFSTIIIIILLGKLLIIFYESRLISYFFKQSVKKTIIILLFTEIIIHWVLIPNILINIL